MRIERRVLEQFSALAEAMLRPVGKRGSRRYAALRPWVQLLRAPAGTVLSAHVGYLALQRIVSDVRIPSSIACGDSWLQACTAKQACKGNAGFVELSLHDRHIRFHWRSGGRSRLLRLQTHPPQSLGPVPPLYRVGGDLMRALDLCGRVVDHQETRYSLACVKLDAHRGSVIGTDGKQLLQVSGCAFAGQPAPVLAPVLVPVNGIFSSPLLSRPESLRCGISSHALVIQIDPWTLRLPLQLDGRYGDVDVLLERLKKPVGRAWLDAADLAELRHWIENPPGGLRYQDALVLRLGETIEVLATPAGPAGPNSTAGRHRWPHMSLSRQPSRQLSRQLSRPLRRSSHRGIQADYLLDRKYLLTIIGLNLHELLHFGQGWPLVAQAAATRYVCQTMRVSNHARGLSASGNE